MSTAAIYEALELAEKKLVLRIGNKSIRCFGPDLQKEWEIETKYILRLHQYNFMGIFPISVDKLVIALAVLAVIGTEFRLSASI